MALIAVVGSLAVPSARRRRQEARAVGVADLPPEPAEVHLPHHH